MYLLVQKSTNIVADIQPQPFPVTDEFEWIENKSVDERTMVGYSYNKQTKEFIAPTPIPQRPSELSNTIIAQKLEELEGKIDMKAEPRLGIAEPQPTFNWLYLLAIPLAIGAYLLGKKI